MATDLSARDVERANFAFSIYDFEGNGTMDAFFVGEALRGLNFNPTLALIEKIGGTKKKKEKILKIEEFLTIFSACKKEKEMGSYEDFLELLKLYDKAEDGNMHLGELEHILLSIGERLEPHEAKVILAECANEEDEDGLIPYVPFIKKLVAGPFPNE